MAMAHAGFVFLAMTKTGSTSVESAFARHAQLTTRRPPPMKHMTARTFDKLIVPVLEQYGFARESYEVLAVVREPVDWAHSWYRYRSRPGTEGSAQHTGGLSFEEFAESIVSGEVRLGSSSRFVRTRKDRPPVDRVYRYEHLDEAIGWMAGRLGVQPPEVTRRNASPTTAAAITPSTRRLLEEHFAADVALHASAL